MAELMAGHGWPLALVLLYAKGNRYSMNALVGAIETEPAFDELPVLFPTRGVELAPAVEQALDIARRVVVGISLASAQTATTAELVAQLRQMVAGRRDRVVLVAGGPHASGDPEGTLGMGFDLTVIGEGEATLLDVLKAAGEPERWPSIRGLAIRLADGRAMRTPHRPSIDLDRFPPFGRRRRRRGPMEITRGCPFACRFCQTSYLFGAKVRHRSVARIEELVRDLVANHFDDLRVITPNALSYGSTDGRVSDLGEVERLLVAIRRALGPDRRVFFGSFPSEVRPEHLTREAAALIRRLADNRNLLIGVQSGSDRMLQACHRGHTAEQAVQAAAVLEAGFRVSCDFIFGLPGETAEDAQATRRVVTRLTDMGARIHVHRFEPLVGTPWANREASPGVDAIIQGICEGIPSDLLHGDLGS